MLRLLPSLLIIALTVWALVDVLQRPEDQLTGMPKVLWVLFMLLIPVIGPLVYLFAGRKRTAGPGSPTGRGYGRPQRRTLAPDDDPEFLDKLRHEQWEQERRDRERKLRDEGDPGGAPA